MAVPVIESVDPHERTEADTSEDLGKPTGTVSGDLLLAVIGFAEGDGNSFTITPPSGWTQRLFVKEGSDTTFVGLGVWSKIAGGSEPTTYTFTSSHGVTWSGGILRISGHDPTTFFNTSASTNINNSTSSSQNAPSVTTTVNDCLILRINLTTATTTIAVPSGTTSVFNESDSNVNRACCACGSASQATAGSTGTAAFTGWSTAGNIDGYTATVAIAPAAAAGHPAMRRWGMTSGGVFRPVGFGQDGVQVI